MLRSLQNIFQNGPQKYLICMRSLTATEVSTALRPFYFSVHPDLFGQYPNQRAINETSLQQLSSILESLQASKPITPIILQFYIKDKTQNNVSFRLIKIHLKERNIRSAILTILKSCQLSTEYVDNIAITPMDRNAETFRIKVSDIDFTNLHKNHPIYAQANMQRDIQEAQDALLLRNWLRTNYKTALEKLASHKPYKEEIHRLSKSISEELGLKEIRWECGWNDAHFRGCLLSFQSLAQQHPNPMHILRGRSLVFSYFTGVSLEGDIMLYSGEVRHNWLDLIKNIRKFDASLTRIPAFEKSLSHVLRNIKIGRRKFMPKITSGDYENNLRQITTSLSDYKGYKSFPKQWPESLEEFELVVETEAGPLMVSPTGQFIVPSTLPGVLLVSFITTHLHEAAEKMNDYKRDKYVERSLHKRVIEAFNLAELHKDDNVTPDLMIKCCEKFLIHKHILEPYLSNINLNISTYYSVLSDGVVCIPWNWEL